MANILHQLYGNLSAIFWHYRPIWFRGGEPDLDVCRMTQPVDIQRYVEIWPPFAALLAPSMRNEDTTSDYCQRWIQGVIYILISVGVLLYWIGWQL